MRFQIGKAGVTEGVLESLKMGFKTHSAIRISVLRSQAPTKDKVREIAEELVRRLEGPHRFITVGFTIVLKKQKEKK